MNAILKYPGAKWSLADQIISHFPEHHSYLEPFLGSGAVLFSKPRPHIETVNDLDGEVVNLFRCIREDPERLAREVYFTPYSREAFEESYSAETVDPFVRATGYLVRCNQGYGYRTNELPTITQTSNDPLTPEQMREMYGEPVWIETADIKKANRWAFVDVGCEIVRFFDTRCGVKCTVMGNHFRTYGKTWLAYRRKPEAPANAE